MENVTKLPSMTFGESVKSVLSNLLNFNGRSRRSELWWYYLLYAVVSFVLNMVLAGLPVLSGIVGVVLLMSVWAVTVRRLHDRGHSGWRVLVSVLVNVFMQFYFIGSGYNEAIAAVNPDPEVAMGMLTDPVVMICGLVSFVVNISIFVFCIMDGKPEPNKYGLSPKYVSETI